MSLKRCIYGLGENYKEKKFIFDNLYGELFYCDKDDNKMIGIKRAITLNELKNKINEFDEVIITFGEVLRIAEAIKDIGAKSSQYKLGIQVVNEIEPMFVRYSGEEGIDAMLDAAIAQIGKSPSQVKYVEIGTNDPVNGNNSYHLYQMGARGLLVDPLPQSEIVSKITRPEDKFCRAAIVANKEHDEIDFFVDMDIASALSSVNAHHYENWGGKAPQKITVPALTVEELLIKASFEPDALLIDAEGEDENLLRAIPFQNHKIPIIVVEVCDMSYDRYFSVIKFMKENGYELFTTTARRVNSIFIRK